LFLSQPTSFPVCPFLLPILLRLSGAYLPAGVKSQHPGGSVPEDSQTEFSSFSSFGLKSSRGLVVAFFDRNLVNDQQWVCDYMYSQVNK